MIPGGAEYWKDRAIGSEVAVKDIVKAETLSEAKLIALRSIDEVLKKQEEHPFGL